MGFEAGRPKYLRDSNTCQQERERESNTRSGSGSRRECVGEREYLADTLSTSCRVLVAGFASVCSAVL